MFNTLTTPASSTVSMLSFPLGHTIAYEHGRRAMSEFERLIM
jgi:hypothetical protein